MTGSGFSDEAAVEAYRAYTSFLLGHLLLEVSQRGVPITSEDSPGGSPHVDVDLHDFPHLRRLQPLLAQDESAAEFEEALESLVERLGALLHRPHRQRPKRAVSGDLGIAGKQG